MTKPLDWPATQIGVIIVDHGSRRAESNEMLVEVVDEFRRASDYAIVEPAHMEIAEPSIQVAFDRCVQQGARLVVVYPYFLLPGRHWDQDIPRLVGRAAAAHQGISYLVTAPFGLHPLMTEIIRQRIDSCMRHALDKMETCDVCTGNEECSIVQATTDS